MTEKKKIEQMLEFLNRLNVPGDKIGEITALKANLRKRNPVFLCDYLGKPAAPLLSVNVLFIRTKGKGRLETYVGYRTAYVDFEKRFPKKYVLGISREGYREGEIIRFDIFSPKTAIIL